MANDFANFLTFCSPKVINYSINSSRAVFYYIEEFLLGNLRHSQESPRLSDHYLSSSTNIKQSIRVPK